MRQARAAAARGFTLVELLTVMALMLVVTTMAVASLGPLRRATAALQGAEQVRWVLVAARQAAMATGRCTRLELLDERGNALPAGSTVPARALRLRQWSTPHCEPGLTVPERLEPGGRLFPLPAGVAAVRTAPAEPDLAEWLPTGRTRSAQSALFTVHSGGRAFRLEATPHGPVCLAAGESGSCP